MLATNERRALQNKNSQLSNSINQQTKDAATKAKANTIDPVTDSVIDKASGGSGNTASQPSTGDSQATTTSAPSSTRDFGDMQYPATIAQDTGCYYIYCINILSKNTYRIYIWW